MDKVDDKPKVEDLYAGGDEKVVTIEGHDFKLRGCWSWGDIQKLRSDCMEKKSNGQNQVDQEKLDNYTVLAAVVDSPFHARDEWNVATLKKLKRTVVESLLVEITKSQYLGGDVAKN